MPARGRLSLDLLLPVAEDCVSWHPGDVPCSCDRRQPQDA